MKGQNIDLFEKELFKYYILDNIRETYYGRSIAISEILKGYYEWRRQNIVNIISKEDNQWLLTIFSAKRYYSFSYLYYGRGNGRLRMLFEECVLEKISEYIIDNYDILYSSYLSTIQSERAWMNPIRYYNKNNDWKHIVCDMMSDKARKKYNTGKYTHDIISD